jgi:predicted regulator of Ras-like GTPase activity (Roadblock/LC7/MglB family)
MNEEVYAIALKSALAEIQNVCEGIRWSFIFTKDGTIISGNDDKSIGSEIAKAAGSFQGLTEKARAVGGLDRLLINGDKGKVYVSSIDDMYFVSGTSKEADIDYMRSITSVVFPTIKRVLDNIGGSAGEVSPTPLKPLPLKPLKEEAVEAEEEEELAEPAEKEVKRAKKVKGLPPVPSQQLIVDKLGGLLVRADTVQVDSEVLKRWNALLGVKEVKEVQIETFGGKMAQCRVKTISDRKLEGRGLIRIPEKTCQMLEIKRGELVRVKPLMREK